jgi:hypothetical protein
MRRDKHVKIGDSNTPSWERSVPVSGLGNILWLATDNSNEFANSGIAAAGGGRTPMFDASRSVWIVRPAGKLLDSAGRMMLYFLCQSGQKTCPGGRD